MADSSRTSKSKMTRRMQFGKLLVALGVCLGLVIPCAAQNRNKNRPPQQQRPQRQAARQELMQTALLAASRVPLEVARTARRLLDACERGVESASPMTASDIGVGALMAEAALRGAALNVMVNLASIKDPAQVKALSEDLDHVLEGADEQRRRITDFVESRIAR